MLLRVLGLGLFGVAVMASPPAQKANDAGPAPERPAMTRDWAPHKARVDPPEKLPPEARLTSGPERGFTFFDVGMYWRDINKVTVDLDRGYISYDLYRHGREPLQGHVDIDATTRDAMLALAQALWKSPSDNAEDPKHPAAPQIVSRTVSLLLADGEARRHFRFSTEPLKELAALRALTWEQVPGLGE